MSCGEPSRTPLGPSGGQLGGEIALGVDLVEDLLHAQVLEGRALGSGLDLDQLRGAAAVGSSRPRSE